MADSRTAPSEPAPEGAVTRAVSLASAAATVVAARFHAPPRLAGELAASGVVRPARGPRLIWIGRAGAPRRRRGPRLRSGRDGRPRMGGASAGHVRRGVAVAAGSDDSLEACHAAVHVGECIGGAHAETFGAVGALLGELGGILGRLDVPAP